MAGAGTAYFSCALCGKTFERRDLRERHRRRCEKSLDKVRSHKRKSCNLCARSKVKCDLQTPTCQRCLDRHTECEYPTESSSAAISHWHENVVVPVSAASGSFTTSPDDLLSTDFAITNGQLETAPGQLEPMIGDGDMHIDWATGLNNGNPLEFWNTRAWNLTPAEMEALAANAVPKVHSPSNMAIQEAVSNATIGQQIGDSDFLASLGADFQLGSVDGAVPLRESSSPNPAPHSILSPALERRSASRNRDGNSTGKRPKINHSSNTETHLPRNQQAPRTGVSDVPALQRPRTFVSSITGSPVARTLPDESRRASPKSPDVLSTCPSCSSSPPSMTLETMHSSRSFSINEVMTVICDYPKQLLRPNFWSPFVHHRHYRCSQGGLAEPIAIALCCVSANQQYAESSLPFLCNLISTERERLVKEFPSKLETIEDAMAALHAMCIYQIETILVFRSRKSVKPQLSSAELHHHFLLQMTRRLCQRHLESLSSKDNTAVEWQTWTTMETLRRTTFLVNMVNELSYHTKGLNLVYYDPLHPSLVLDMPLPAPDSMWRALNEREWAAARDSSGWTGANILSLRESMELNTEAASADERILGNRGEDHKYQPISNLIISSARHIQQQSQQSLEPLCKTVV
ncbi:MAG: hypothetical protein Q9219_007429 [cf. Caloplaca sp. 3 TL-2023]